MQNAQNFFNAALQPLKSQSLETNLTEAIFRHFQHATKKTGEHKVFLKIDVWLGVFGFLDASARKEMDIKERLRVALLAL